MEIQPIKSLFLSRRAANLARWVGHSPCQPAGGRRGIDHRLQVSKLALGLAVIEEPLDQQAAADEEDRGENDHREGVQQITALFLHFAVSRRR